MSSYYSILQLLELALYYIIVFILKQKNHYYAYSIPLVGFEYSLQAIKIQSEPCLIPCQFYLGGDASLSGLGEFDPQVGPVARIYTPAGGLK